MRVMYARDVLPKGRHVFTRFSGTTRSTIASRRCSSMAYKKNIHAHGVERWEPVIQCLAVAALRRRRSLPAVVEPLPPLREQGRSVFPLTWLCGPGGGARSVR